MAYSTINPPNPKQPKKSALETFGDYLGIATNVANLGLNAVGTVNSAGAADSTQKLNETMKKLYDRQLQNLYPGNVTG